MKKVLIAITAIFWSILMCFIGTAIGSSSYTQSNKAATYVDPTLYTSPEPTFEVTTRVPTKQLFSPSPIPTYTSPTPTVKKTTKAPVAPKILKKTKSPTKKATTPPAQTTYRPGAFCKSSMVGSTFVKNGTVYTCKGPGQPRWRK